MESDQRLSQPHIYSCRFLRRIVFGSNALMRGLYTITRGSAFLHFLSYGPIKRQAMLSTILTMMYSIPSDLGNENDHWPTG